jgi:integrase
MSSNLQPLSEGEVRTLFKGITNPRDQAIVRLMLCSALRVSEIERLNKDSINATDCREFGRGELKDTKRGKPRLFPVDDETLHSVWDWLSARPRNHSRALFVDSRGRRLSAQAIGRRLEYWSKPLGLPDLRSHRLRYTCVARLVRAGVSKGALSRLLGLKSGMLQQAILVTDEWLIREYVAGVKRIQLGEGRQARPPRKRKP